MMHLTVLTAGFERKAIEAFSPNITKLSGQPIAPATVPNGEKGFVAAPCFHFFFLVYAATLVPFFFLYFETACFFGSFFVSLPSSKSELTRCPECDGRVSPHKAGGSTPAHFEHLPAHAGCSHSSAFDGVKRPHLNPIY